MMPAAEISRQLAVRVDQLALELLPGGRREGRQWRCGSVAGEPGGSLAVELAGDRRGLWHDHATGQGGDALDLVAACVGGTTAEAIRWAAGWLGIEPGETSRPRRPVMAPERAPDRAPTWPKVWREARPIFRTLADRYLSNRGLVFDEDDRGDVLRFHPRRVRLQPGTTDQFEHHPALLALVRDVITGEPCGLHSIFLRADGSDRLRDKKGKKSDGRIKGGAVMLSEDVTYGLTVAEGVETAIGVLMAGLAPCWACCGASNLAAFPFLPVIQALTVAADAGAAGEAAAQEAAARWHKAGRQTRVVSPQADDWAATA